jgi:hypothetical protein
VYRHEERCGNRERNSHVGKLIHACVASSYDFDGSDNVHATVQNKSSYLKILKI